MAEITFGTYQANNLGGSGIGFYGTTFGASVQVGQYQGRSYITNSNGTVNGGNAKNTKYNHPASGIPEDVASGIPLVRINGSERLLDINFDHSVPVSVQNVQLRIYDRANINYPASGVNTKVAEIVNFNGLAHATWLGAPGAANTLTAYGSGDQFWWGSPWPAANTTQGFYTNSVGVKFYNGRSSDAKVNGDVRLTAVGADETVGGTGIIVPLLDSPGSGQRFLHRTYDSAFQPKWKQYYNSSAPLTVPNIGAAATTRTFGGTGIDTRHTWRVLLSGTPNTVGSKTNYAMHVSLEYL
jgi:hypothetical protein